MIKGHPSNSESSLRRVSILINKHARLNMLVVITGNFNTELVQQKDGCLLNTRNFKLRCNNEWRRIPDGSTKNMIDFIFKERNINQKSNFRYFGTKQTINTKKHSKINSPRFTEIAFIQNKKNKHFQSKYIKIYRGKENYRKEIKSLPRYKSTTPLKKIEV